MRKQYIQQQKQERGLTPVAVLPIHYPKELLTAMDVLSVELWGPPGPPRGTEAGRLQTYVCSVVRNALAFLASGGADLTEAVLFPHTCDAIQGLASVAPDVSGWSKPAFRFIHPRGEKRDSARKMLIAELNKLAAGLEQLTGKPLDAGKLRRAIGLHLQINALRRRLLEHRTRVPIDDPALYALLRRGEFLWPADHLEELQAAAADLREAPVQEGVPIMITGYVPEPATLLTALGDAGLCVVADDYAATGRRVLRTDVELGEGGIETLADLAFARPPCPTLTASQQRRMSYLEDLYRESGARGLIIHAMKFCEPELFDVPAIRKRFGALRVPVLYLESELETQLSAQTITRIEAFAEMVASSRRAA